MAADPSGDVVQVTATWGEASERNHLFGWKTPENNQTNGFNDLYKYFAANYMDL